MKSYEELIACLDKLSIEDLDCLQRGIIKILKNRGVSLEEIRTIAGEFGCKRYADLLREVA